MTGVARQGKGARRRQDIIDAAATIIRESGPTAVSHRTVAARAECSLSATTYYFSGLEELLAEAGRVNIEMWAIRAERVAQEISHEPLPKTCAQAASLVLRACLPSAETLETHYHQLVAVSDYVPVTSAYRAGRQRLDAAVASVLERLGVGLSAELMIAIVDGAAVAALSEGRSVRETARALVERVLEKVTSYKW